MNRLAGILRHRAAQNLYLAGVGVHFDVDAGRGECRSYADAAGADLCPSGDRTAGSREAAGELLHVHWLEAVAFRAEDTVFELDVLGLLLPGLRGALLELL